MKSLLQLLTSHPYAVLFVSGLLERAGAPLFSSPVLIGAGALAATGHIQFDVGVWVALLACIPGDILWYELGRAKGDSVLSTLCRISFERDSCVRRSKLLFEKGVTRTVLFSKWVPGISHIVPAIAGLTKVARERFIIADALGSALWIIGFMMLGYLPLQQSFASGLGTAVGPIVFEAGVVVLVATSGIKYIRKRQFVRDLYKARITPEELRTLMDSNESILILDLRHPLDSLTDPRRIPGAFRVLPEDVADKVATLAGKGEIVLYCT
jgi:membrane protein DedA with SNARE-associated domain